MSSDTYRQTPSPKQQPPQTELPPTPTADWAASHWERVKLMIESNKKNHDKGQDSARDDFKQKPESRPAVAGAVTVLVSPLVHWLRLPKHVRRGLLRLYVVVSVPWVAWFGYQIYNVLEVYCSRFSWCFDDVSEPLWSLLIVPIGGPLSLLALLWVVAGLRKSALGPPMPNAQASPTQVEWRDDATRIREEVSSDILDRPDLAVYTFLTKGRLFRGTLDESKLTPNQKATLPKGTYGPGGLNPGAVAPMFAYQSAEMMLDDLMALERGRGEMPFKDYLVKIVDAEVDRRRMQKLKRTQTKG
jgi:hypothetical protein